MKHVVTIALGISAGAIIAHILDQEWWRLVVVGVLVAIGAYLWDRYLWRVGS